MNKTMDINRRQLIKGLGVGAAALATATPWSFANAQAADPRFLIVFTGTGGASIIDAMLARRESESVNSGILNTFPDDVVQSIAQTPFNAVDLAIGQDPRFSLDPLPYNGQTNQSGFVTRNAQDMMVVTHTGTSVNHLIAQKRALTGNEAWGGRTLQEVVAATYGESFPIPNVSMGVGGYVEPGIDPTIPNFARSQVVTNALLFFAGLHGSQGISGAPSAEVVRLARQFRNERLDENSGFAQTFRQSKALQLWKDQRQRAGDIEAADLITQLNVIPDSVGIPLAQFGLGSSPDLQRVRQAFPALDVDPLHAQAALAYLLIKNRVSVTVTLGPPLAPLVGVSQIVDSPPLAFDFSHSSHRGAQAVMWHRILDTMDRLIALLREEQFGDGGSFWDRSMIYLATDFGRTRNRSSGANLFGTGHHLNNGSLIVSPMANGNQVLGGVDTETMLTYGFDPMTGQPMAPGQNMEERQIYLGILQALGIDTSSVMHNEDMRAMRRA